MAKVIDYRQGQETSQVPEEKLKPEEGESQAVEVPVAGDEESKKNDDGLEFNN